MSTLIGSLTLAQTTASCPDIPWKSARVNRLRADELLGEVTAQAVERDALLRHAVPLAHCHGLVVERVEVDGDAERRADLVLPAVAPTDCSGIVEVDVPVLAKVCRELARDGRELLIPGQRKHGHLDRGEP